MSTRAARTRANPADAADTLVPSPYHIKFRPMQMSESAAERRKAAAVQTCRLGQFRLGKRFPSSGESFGRIMMRLAGATPTGRVQRMPVLH